MHTLRTILVCLAFAAADMAMPAVPNALEVIDEADESEYHLAPWRARTEDAPPPGASQP